MLQRLDIEHKHQALRMLHGASDEDSLAALPLVRHNTTPQKALQPQHLLKTCTQTPRYRCSATIKILAPPIKISQCPGVYQLHACHFCGNAELLSGAALRVLQVAYKNGLLLLLSSGWKQWAQCLWCLLCTPVSPPPNLCLLCSAL